MIGTDTDARMFREHLRPRAPPIDSLDERSEVKMHIGVQQLAIGLRGGRRVKAKMVGEIYY
jgi:hypothetical protein